MKKVVALLLAGLFILSSSGIASENTPLKNLGKGLDTVTTGVIEIPDNINETNTKGTPAYPSCTDKTKSGLGRAIAKVVGGAWQLATFWYPSDNPKATK